MNLLSVWSTPHHLPFEDVALPGETPAAETVVVEAQQLPQAAPEIFRRLLETGHEERRVYLVDLEQDQIAEYRRTSHTNLAALIKDKV
jgi:hypothetical protein